MPENLSDFRGLVPGIVTVEMLPDVRAGHNPVYLTDDVAI
jgi:hypothetical protein